MLPEDDIIRAPFAEATGKIRYGANPVPQKTLLEEGDMSVALLSSKEEGRDGGRTREVGIGSDKGERATREGEGHLGIRRGSGREDSSSKCCCVNDTAGKGMVD